MRWLAAIQLCALACPPAQAQSYRAGFRPGFQFLSRSCPWVPTAFRNATLYVDATRVAADSTYGTACVNGVERPLNQILTRTATGGQAITGAGTVVSFSGTALRSTDLGLTNEAGRTNIFLNSGSPATQTRAVASGSTYTTSVRGTGSIALSGACTGTATQGSPVQCLASSTSLTATVSGAVTNPQIELGAGATSPIVSSGSSTARAADSYAFSDVSWASQGTGTLVAWVTYEPPSPINMPNALTGSDSGASTYSRLGVNASGVISGTTAGGTGATVTGGTVTGGALQKMAYAWGAASSAVCLNGTVSARGGGVAPGIYTVAYPGQLAGAGTNSLSIDKVYAYFPYNLSDAELVQVTQ